MITLTEGDVTVEAETVAKATRLLRRETKRRKAARDRARERAFANVGRALLYTHSVGEVLPAEYRAHRVSTPDGLTFHVTVTDAEAGDATVELIGYRPVTIRMRADGTTPFIETESMFGNSERFWMAVGIADGEYALDDVPVGCAVHATLSAPPDGAQ